MSLPFLTVGCCQALCTGNLPPDAKYWQVIFAGHYAKMNVILKDRLCERMRRFEQHLQDFQSGGCFRRKCN